MGVKMYERGERLGAGECGGGGDTHESLYIFARSFSQSSPKILGLSIPKLVFFEIRAYALYVCGVCACVCVRASM